MSSFTSAYYHPIEWEVEDGDADGIPGVSVVPDKWLVVDTNQCRWPPVATTQMMRRNASPKRDWATHSYSRLVKSAPSWERMKRLERDYLNNTDVNSTAEESDPGIRKRKTTSRVLWDSPAASPDRGSPSPPPPPPSLPLFVLRSVSTPSASALPFSPPPPPRTAEPAAPRSSPQVCMEPEPQILSVEAVDYKPFFEALLKNQEQIKAVLHQQRAEIHSLRAQVRRLENGCAEEREESSNRPELPGSFQFPLETEEELKGLEEKLADETIRKRLERYLYNLGGSSYKISLCTAGGKLLSPSLQGRFNLTGSNKSGQQKLAFNSLTNVKRVLYNAVHKRHQTPHDVFSLYLSDWLSTWRVRLAGGGVCLVLFF